MPTISADAATAFTEMVVAIACFAAAYSAVRVAFRSRRVRQDARRAAALMAICLGACGVSRLLELFVLFGPPAAAVLIYIEALLGLCALIAGALVWRFMPSLTALPTVSELTEANDKLAAQERALAALVRQLEESNRKLEGRVAQRTRELSEANRRFELALRGSGIAMSQQDGALRYLWVHNAPQGLDAQVLIGTAEAGLPPETAALLTRRKQAVLQSGAPATFEFPLTVAGETRWFEERVEPVTEAGQIVGVISTAIDITAHKRHELELTEFLQELTHRSKNLLAVVQGIARQTGVGVKSVPDFIGRFTARLQALSLAHDMLVATNWSGVDLRTLVLEVARATAGKRAERIEVNGPEIKLAPEAAQMLALGLHELASNAIAHGALRTDGAVAIEWREDADDALLCLEWRETGMPALPAPPERRFGIGFVDSLLPRAVGGASQVEFAEKGLRYRLRFPLRTHG